MIAETEIPLFVLCTSSLTAAFAYYIQNTENSSKKTQPNQLTKTPNQTRGDDQTENRLQKSITTNPEFFEKTILSLLFLNQKHGFPFVFIG